MIDILISRKIVLWKIWYRFASWDFSLWAQKEEKIYTDVELVQYILDGKKEYFELIVDRWGQRLFRYLYHYFAFDKTTAEDAVQEVFVHVWKHLDKYDASKTFSTWLYTVARNRIIDWLRQQKQETKTQKLEKWDLVEDKNIELKKWKKYLLESILNQLDNKYSEVLILYYFEEMKYDEIAEIIWSNKNTVGTLVSRAKKKVKEIVGGDEILCEALEIDTRKEEY